MGGEVLEKCGGPVSEFQPRAWITDVVLSAGHRYFVGRPVTEAETRPAPRIGPR
jgi:hypothetical protein